MLDEIRDMASEAAKCRNPVRRKELRKIARKARRKFEAGSDPQTVVHETLGERMCWGGIERVDRGGQSSQL